ncbi:hypothetical protein FRC01_001622 [Tulasnella sp. 417]|nr:hypothetical protein FRC01_001622 [Tulasnella sp. 417]
MARILSTGGISSNLTAKRRRLQHCPPGSRCKRRAKNFGKHEKWDKYPPAKVPALATALLMSYLSSLPVALVPEGRFAEFAEIHEASKRGDSSQTTTSRYFELLCDLPPSNMYLLMYIAETLDYIGRHARVEVSDLAKTFAECVFRPQAPARPRQTAIEILKDLISHRDLDAQLLRLNRRSDEQSVDLTIRGDMRLDYVVSLAQQQSILALDIEDDDVEMPDDNPTTNIETESASQQTARQTAGAPAQATPSLAPSTGPWASKSSLEDIPDLSKFIQKDRGAGKKWGGFCEVYVGNYDQPETSERLLVALRLPNMRHAADATQRRFIREVRLWFGLKHQNINPLLGTFSDEDGNHMVSPWRRRGDVFSLLKAKKLNSTETEKILLGVSHALCYLHAEGYVHGDLKMACDTIS